METLDKLNKPTIFMKRGLIKHKTVKGNQLQHYSLHTTLAFYISLNKFNHHSYKINITI